MGAQSLGPALQQRLEVLAAPSGSSLLLWDLPRSTALAGVRAEFFRSAHCVGSLIKPFLILAYSRDYPTRSLSEPLRPPFAPCRGRATTQCPVDCWYKPGHGPLGLKQALAASCNQYFYQLAERTSSRAFLETLVQLGLKKPELSTQHSAQDVAEALVSPKMMIGLDPDLEFIPMQVFQGYLELVSSGSSRSSSGSGRGILEPAGALIVAALRLGAMQGTSVLAGRSLPARHHLLGKTGTCPAFAAGRYLTNQTDGWFVGFYPAQQPTLGVMVRYPNGLGARDAAPLGGQAIRAYLELIR